MGGEGAEAQAPPLVSIEPNRFASRRGMKRPMDGDKRIWNGKVCRQRRQVHESISIEVAACPINRSRGRVAKACCGDLPCNSAVVITSHTQDIVLPQQLNAFYRICIVSDYIPKT